MGIAVAWGRRAGAALGIGIALVSCGREPVVAPTRTILLISVDTLRPDRLGAYGNEPTVSPAIDALAARATVFDQALAPAPWTTPSHMTMLTGLDIATHAVWSPETALAEEVVTLAERLRDHGFRTAAFTDAGYVHSRYGFGQGFEIYDDDRRNAKLHGFAHFLQRALDWMREMGDEPWFLFIHTLDAHAPYHNIDLEVLKRFRKRPVVEDPRDDLLATTRFFHLIRSLKINQYPRIGDLLNDYDAGVHVADRGVGALIDQLKASGRFEDALVIVTSDHGESFLDHGAFIGHGMGLKDDEIGIPLIVRFPGGEGAGQRVETLVDLQDVVPTVLAAVGIEAQTSLGGEDLRGLVRGRPRQRSFSIGASSHTGSWYLVEDGYKYISAPEFDSKEWASKHIWPTTPPVMSEVAPGENYSTGGGRLGPRYDWEGDPLGARDFFSTRAHLFDRSDRGERTDLSSIEPDRAERMRARLEELRDESIARGKALGAGGRHVTEDAETRAQLEALGYLGPLPEHEGIPEIPQDSPDSIEPPDMTPLRVHDRRVHSIRIQFMQSGELGAVELQQLGDANRAYARWGAAHPDHAARSQWREREVEALVRSAGASLDTDSIPPAH